MSEIISDEEIALFAAQDYELSRYQGGPNHLKQIILTAIRKAKSLSERIYNTEESKAILDLCERQGLSEKQLLRQALREYQAKVLGPVDLGPKAPPSVSEPKELEEEKHD